MSQLQGWTSGPNVRGSFDILWTCLSTMGLCVWTAVHPNIPVVHKFWPALLGRSGLMLLGIIFPEIILTTAWDQRRAAKSLLLEVNKSMGYVKAEKRTQNVSPLKWLNFRSAQRSQQDDSPLPTDSVTYLIPHRVSPSYPLASPVTPWSIEQAMFAIMGGFAMETRYKSQTNEQRTIRRLVTAEGISILARAGNLPHLNLEDVRERSKADIFAKCIVVGQIIWFALQVLGRLCQRLSVTLLETHTTIHVGCAILMYVIWFSKPYNLTQSIVVTGPVIDSIAALFNFYDISHKVYRMRVEKYEQDRIQYWKERVIKASRGADRFDPPPKAPVLKSLNQLLDEYQTIPTEYSAATYNEDDYILHAIAPDAIQGLYILESQGCGAILSSPETNLELLRLSSENFTFKTVWGGWSTDIGHEPTPGKGIHVLFNILYGGCHLAAWSAFFPTGVECWLWRGSALFLITVPIWATLWILWWRGVRSQHRMLSFIRSGDLDIIAAPFFFSVLMCYTLARCYFLVEALISLRVLPSDAFSSVQWASFLPHVA